VLSAWLFHGVVWLALVFGGFYVIDHPDVFWVVVREPPRWLGGIAIAAAMLKLLTAGWAVRAIYRQHLLATSQLTGFLALWLLAWVGLFAFLAVLLPAGLVPWPWLACGVVLVLPLARVALAPLALAWSRHR